MVRADEEDRAVLYRQQVARRDAWRTAQERALRGNDATAQQLRDDWEPVILARLEWRESAERDDDE